MTTGSAVLLAERDGDVVVLILNRPAAANAINEELNNALVAQLDAAGADDGVRAVVLAAAGERTFSAGADLKEFADLERGAASRKRRALLLRTLAAVVDVGKPLVAAVQAKALGAGCMLALLADEVIAAEAAQFGMPEIAIGMASPIGVSVIGARGGRNAVQCMVQGGKTLDAQAARALGLVDEIVETERLRTKSLERARALARLSGPAYAGNKQWLNRELRGALDAAAVEAGRLQDAAPRA